jgi:hypothetical protein
VAGFLATTDSSFALAHYRLAVAAAWTGRMGLLTPSITRALALAPRLGERDRALLSAFADLARGAPDSAERRYREVLEAYPEDLEARFQLANVLYSYNAPRGRPPGEAREHYDRVLEVDPQFICPRPCSTRRARGRLGQGRHADPAEIPQRLPYARAYARSAPRPRACGVWARTETAGEKGRRKDRALEAECFCSYLRTWKPRRSHLVQHHPSLRDQVRGPPAPGVLAKPVPLTDAKRELAAVALAGRPALTDARCWRHCCFKAKDDLRSIRDEGALAPVDVQLPGVTCPRAALRLYLGHR